jgi:hypothetical protein
MNRDDYDDYYRDKMRQEEEEKDRMLMARIEENLRGMSLIDILVEIIYNRENFKDRMIR